MLYTLSVHGATTADPDRREADRTERTREAQRALLSQAVLSNNARGRHETVDRI